MDHDADQRLIAAVRAGDDTAVAEALAGGANPNVTVGRFRGSVLTEAAGAGRSGIVRLLLTAGARVEPADDRSVSPLRAAALGAHPDVVEMLLAHGAGLATASTTRRGLIADVVAHIGHACPTRAALQTLRLLLAAGENTVSREEAPLIDAVMRSAAPAVLRVLFDHGSNPDDRRSDGTPAIVVAARRDDHAAADVLIQAGAEVDARDARGRTALMHAVERNCRQVAAVLLLAGADVDAASADGTTALQLARGWQWQNIQFVLGQQQVGLDNVPVARTALRLTPTAIRLDADPALFETLADVITIALDDLGDDEWETRTGLSPDSARRFAQRLRTDVVPAPNAAWHQLEATAEEFASARAALVELAYGTTRIMPDGVTRLEIIDLDKELQRQFGTRKMS